MWPWQSELCSSEWNRDAGRLKKALYVSRKGTAKGLLRLTTTMLLSAGGCHPYGQYTGHNLYCGYVLYRQTKIGSYTLNWTGICLRFNGCFSQCAIDFWGLRDTTFKGWPSRIWFSIQTFCIFWEGSPINQKCVTSWSVSSVIWFDGLHISSIRVAGSYVLGLLIGYRCRISSWSPCWMKNSAGHLFEV